MHVPRAMSTATSYARRTGVILLLVIAIAAVLRLWDLELRPPHHDEGVNGWFAERVHRDGFYIYDPTNYHGPVYFHLLAAARDAFGFGLWQLRLPGALIGIVACFVPLLLRRRIGWPASLAGCAVLAASPTLVYYARYAIHETLLAALGLLAAACTLRWADRGRLGWLYGAAACVAGMIATKETTILFLAAGGLWLAGEATVESVRARRIMILGHQWRWSVRLVLIAGSILLMMGAIHVIAFTGAFQTPGSITDQLRRSIDAYFVWQRTGIDEGGHIKSAWYYLGLGARYELALYTFAAVGGVAGFKNRAIRGPLLVGTIMLALYSVIPYKMPWLPISWLALLAIPAGYGIAFTIRMLRASFGRAVAGIAIAVAVIPALAITWRSSFVSPAARQEALAYVHTDPDYDRWFRFVRMAGGRDVLVAVDSDVIWPLPWSLTPYRNTRWQARGDEQVIIAAQGRAATIEERLTTSYLRGTYRLRDASDPVVVYLRHRTFATLLDKPTLASLSIVEPAAAGSRHQLQSRGGSSDAGVHAGARRER
jgi:uncharacterized protein (TIGR03663 family)